MFGNPKYPRLERLAWSVLAMALVGLVGWLDHVTGPLISFSVFYLVPICLAAWRSGFWGGLIVALASAIVWFMAEYVWGMPYVRSIVPFWNALVHFEFFVLTVMLICNITHLNQSLAAQAAHLRQEVAERRQAQEALAESQKMFRLITENVADLIAVLALDGQRLYSSPSYETVLDNSEALRGRDFLQEVMPEDREALKTVMRATVQTGRNQRAEYRLVVPGQPLRYMESEWSVIREKEGAVLNLVVVSRDVSARKRVELLFAEEKAILELIAQGKPLREVLTTLIEKTEQWSDGVYCSILVRDVDENPAIHECSAFLGACAGNGVLQPVRNAVEAQWDRFHDAGLAAGLALVYDTPIISTLRESLGTIRIYARDPQNAEAARLQIYEKIAHVAAIALERQRSEETLRRLSSLILNAQEAERLRLARELHDSVSQMLASVGFRVESILAQIPPEQQTLRLEVTKARFLLKKAIHEVRSISENLRPSELDELGLVAAVRDFCEDFKERSQLELELRLPPVGERFSNEIELALYRVVQEALTNIEKHAEASQIRLTLQSDSDFVTLTIRDDGKGLKSADNRGAGKRSGMGLLDMRERCAFLGGSFVIRSEPEIGTVVAARIPKNQTFVSGVV